MTDQTDYIPTILIADDDPDLRELLRAHLDDLTCEIVEAHDGAQALELVITENPDLVVLDVMMPELNGWEICKYIRSKPEMDHVGVVMLTGIGAAVNELTSPLFGADEYIDKPFSIDELDFKIRKVLSERRKKRA